MSKLSRSAILRLASASPRRRELLQQIGVPHVVAAADVDERPAAAESAADYVLRVACAKALQAWRSAQDLPVLGADTTVVVDGALFGKPQDQRQAGEMLEALSGRTHQVLTAVAVVTAAATRTALSISTVRLRATTAEERLRYWNSGEPRDKAGGYAIQGLGAVFIESLEGSYSGVMGLPLFETAGLLRASGVAYWRTEVR